MDHSLRSLAETVGDELTQEMRLGAIYHHACMALAEAGLAHISKDELADFCLAVFQRRQDRFPSTPIFNQAGVYASR